MTLERIYKRLEAVSTLKQTFAAPHLPSATPYKKNTLHTDYKVFSSQQ